jgi:hypothetical protein
MWQNACARYGGEIMGEGFMRFCHFMRSAVAPKTTTAKSRIEQPGISRKSSLTSLLLRRFQRATEVGDRFWMKRDMPSPDAADAMALCFSEPDGSPFPRSSGFTARSNI